MSDGGKGSSPRPYSVEHSKFAERWDMIFKKHEPVVVKCPQCPDDVNVRCEACGVLQKDGTRGWLG